MGAHGDPKVERARGERGLGYIQHKDGAWWWRRSGLDATGQRRQWREGPFKTEAEAMRERDRIGKVTDVDRETVTWEEWLDLWLPRKVRELEANRQHNYAAILERYTRLYYRPNLTGRMAKTTPAELSDLWGRILYMPRQHHYVTNLKNGLHLCVSDAQAAGVMLTNPVTFSKIPKPPYEQEEARAVRPDQVISLERYQELRTWLVTDCESPWGLPTFVAGETGARRGEVLGFQAHDLRPKAQQLRIDRQVLVTKGRPLELGPPKWNSKRVLSVDAGLVRRIQHQIAEVGEVPRSMVFVDDKGGLLNPDDWTRWFSGVVRPKFKLPAGFSLHSLRHTHASILLMSGRWSDIAVAHRLGHSSSVITRQLYTHFIDDPNDGIGDGWASMFD